MKLDQPNTRSEGYWPVVHDGNTDYLENEVGINVGSWWNEDAQAGARIGTLSQRRCAKPDGYPDDSKESQLHDICVEALQKTRAERVSAEKPWLKASSSRRERLTETLKLVPAAVATGLGFVTSHLTFVPGVGMVQKRVSVAGAARADDAEDKAALEAADKAVASAHRQLSKEGKERREEAAEAKHRRALQARVPNLSPPHCVFAPLFTLYFYYVTDFQTKMRRNSWNNLMRINR
jgi:hypothetical protein